MNWGGSLKLILRRSLGRRLRTIVVSFDTL
jgi:hypothetical protein